MASRRRTTTATASPVASVLASPLVLLAIAGLVTHAPFVAEGAFHDGIIGTSLRMHQLQGGNSSNKLDLRWSKEEHNFSRDLQSFTGSKSAKESCETALTKEEADIAPGGGSSKCSCEQVTLDERYAEFIDISTQPIVFELKCVDERCTYCSADGTTCDRFSYGALFEEVTVIEGASIENRVAQVGYFETNQYIVGRPEAVVYTEFSDPANPGAHGCSMEIDGLQCAVCEYINCVDQETGSDNGNDMDVYFGLNIVCSNILISDGAGDFVAANDFSSCVPEEIDIVGQSQGVFEMYDPDYGQCYTSTEGCARDSNALEQDGWYSCDCLDSNLETDGVSPFLENVELSCDINDKSKSESESGSKKICKSLQKDSIERSYSSYVTETNKRSIVLESGSTIAIEETGCQTTAGGSEICSECKASIDGTECTSCDMEDCGEISSPKISCGNASDEIGEDIIDLCLSETATGTPFEAFAECGFGEAKKVAIPIPPTEAPTKTPEKPPPVSMMACREKQSEFLQPTSDFLNSKALKCECYLIDPAEGASDAGTLLECSTSAGICGGSGDVTGSVCNTPSTDGDDESNGVCFREEVVQGFLADGSQTPMTRTTTYTKGNDTNDNSLVGSTLVLTEYGGVGAFCQLMVDGEACSSCELKDCGSGGGIRPLVDCSNIGEGPSYDLTTCEAFSSYDEGFLLRLTDGVGENNENGPNDFSTCRKDIESDDSTGQDFPVDPSLPLTCSGAQPLVLPILEESNLAVASSSTKDVTGVADVTNPNSNFGIVSFVSSTKGLSDDGAQYESAESCAGDVVDESPGLWYSLVGSGNGIFASVCRDATDFAARISIYEGGCGSENLECVAGTTPVDELESDSNGNNGSSPCAVHFIAEEGKTYHLRVHGGSPSETGTFNLFLETLPDEITDACYSDQTNAFSDACLTCSAAKNSRIQQFSIGNDDPTAIDCQCLPNNGTGGYHLTCVDMSCLKCNGRQDVCGFDTYELEIIQEGTPREYESFYFMHNTEGGQASEIAAIQTSECLEIEDPYQVCMAAKEETMATGESEVFCECRGTSEEGDYLLICSIYNTYEYCVESSGEGDDGFCANVLFGQPISKYGAVTSDFRSYTVMLGDDEEEEQEEEATVITVERFGGSCYVSINEDLCASCEIVDTCVNIGGGEDPLDIAPSSLGISSNLPVFTDISVDCSNILQEGQEIDGASATFECGSSGGITNRNNLLSILAGSVSPTEEAIADLEEGTAVLIPEITQTIPPEAFPPTMAPVTRPTNPPDIEDEAEDSGNATSTDLLDDLQEPSTNTTTPTETGNSTKESTADSSAWGLAGKRGIAWLTSSFVTLASVALLLL